MRNFRWNIQKTNIDCPNRANLHKSPNFLPRVTFRLVGWLDFAHFILNILRVHERNFRSRFQRISRFFSLLAFHRRVELFVWFSHFSSSFQRFELIHRESEWYVFFCCVVLLRSQCPDSDSFLFWVHFDIISPTDDGWLSIDDLNILWLAVLAQPSSQLLSSAALCAQSSDDISALNLRLIWAWSFFSSLWVRDARNNAADSQNT